MKVLPVGGGRQGGLLAGGGLHAGVEGPCWTRGRGRVGLSGDQTQGDANTERWEKNSSVE